MARRLDELLRAQDAMDRCHAKWTAKLEIMFTDKWKEPSCLALLLLRPLGLLRQKRGGPRIHGSKLTPTNLGPEPRWPRPPKAQHNDNDWWRQS